MKTITTIGGTVRLPKWPTTEQRLTDQKKHSFKKVLVLSTLTLAVFYVLGCLVYAVATSGPKPYCYINNGNSRNGYMMNRNNDVVDPMTPAGEIILADPDTVFLVMEPMAPNYRFLLDARAKKAMLRTLAKK